MPLYNKDFIKKMTVEDFMKLFGFNPDKDESVVSFILLNGHGAIPSGASPEANGDCKCCVYGPFKERKSCDDCSEGIIEWLNLEYNEPIPVVCKPFSYKGDIVDSFSLDYDGEKTYLVLYDDEESVLHRIPFSVNEQDEMFEAVGGSPAWQWNYLADKFGDKQSVTVVSEYDDNREDN